ncbi:MAG: hypothetical protein WEA61_10965 [Anaerolineales bacterium]
MLNLLRDYHKLAQRGFRLVDSKDLTQVIEIAGKLDEFAVVYVDDFAGTGNQFVEARNFLVEFLSSKISEFFLLPVICEEAEQRISQLGVVPVYSFVHTRDQRPLHPNNSNLSEREKMKFLDYSTQIGGKFGLGYGDAATMVIFYRNAPNSTPLIFRGKKKQAGWIGILPRFDDL